MAIVLSSGVAHAERVNPLANQPCCRRHTDRYHGELALGGWARLDGGAAGATLHGGYYVGASWGLDLDARVGSASRDRDLEAATGAPMAPSSPRLLALGGAHVNLLRGDAWGLGDTFFRIALVANAGVGWSDRGAAGALGLTARLTLATDVTLDVGARELDVIGAGRELAVETGVGFWLR